MIHTAMPTNNPVTMPTVSAPIQYVTFLISPVTMAMSKAGSREMRAL